MSNSRAPRYYALAALAGAALAPATPALAQQFPAAANNETSQSLGMFSIQVTPAFQPTISALYGAGDLPGFNYNATSGVLYSPLLNDPNTQLGTSAPQNTSSLPTNVTVGADGSAVSVPTATTPGTYPAGATPGANTDVVYTQVQSLDLTNGNGIAVKAGTAATSAAGSSYGLVQSNTQPTTNSNNDFPAKSFFDVFVEIDIPITGSGTAILQNPSGSPLLVENNGLTAFPPTVVYTHGGSSSVPIDFVGGPYAGDELGTIQLAGHGVGFSNTPQGIMQFEEEFEADEQANGSALTPSDYAGFDIPQYAPEPGSLTLLAAGLGGLGWLRRRRSRPN